MVSEGLQEVLHAAARAEQVTCVMLNNGVFGETGGHMTATTVLGQRTKTSLEGRDAAPPRRPRPARARCWRRSTARPSSRTGRGQLGRQRRPDQAVPAPRLRDPAGRCGLLLRRDPHHVPDRMVRRDRRGARVPRRHARRGAHTRGAEGRAGRVSEPSPREGPVIAVHGGRVGDAILVGLPRLAARGRSSSRRVTTRRRTSRGAGHPGRRTRPRSRARSPTGSDWVHVLGAGVDGFPLDALAGRTVTCSKGASAPAIAEFVLASMLAFEKRLPETWVRNRPRNGTRRRSGASTGGRSASSASAPSAPQVAQRALAFDMEVLGLRRTDRPSPHRRESPRSGPRRAARPLGPCGGRGAGDRLDRPPARRGDARQGEARGAPGQRARGDP